MTDKVLLIDDDKKLHSLLGEYLAGEAVVLDYASNGREGLSRLERETFDAVVLDVMMPRMNGLEVLRKLRERHFIPVIMLTAKGDETDRVVGLELGADDYLGKPFSPRELLARLRAVLRRTRPPAEHQRLSISGVTVLVESRHVQLEGRDIELTGLEFDLLHTLMRRAGRVVRRERLLDDAGRSDVLVNDRAVDVHISHVRKKLGDKGALIRTVRGVGYTFVREDESFD
jgi:DNA-binding response OmpR family regulator